MSLADTLADQLGHLRIRRAILGVEQTQLGLLEDHLLAAIDIAHTLEHATIPANATDPEFVTTPEPDPVAIEPPPADIPRLTRGGIADKAPKSKGSKYDLAEVATLARDAISRGSSASAYIHARLPGCPSKQMASFLIQEARKAGHDIPKMRNGSSSKLAPPATPTPTPPTSVTHVAHRSSSEPQVPGKRFECSTCDVDADQVRDIQRHTRIEHNRDATTTERTPK